MKNFKKIASAIAALSLAACVAVPMSATVFTASAEAVTSGSITITTTESNHTYKAYQIFDGTLDKDTEGKITFSNVVWGKGMKSDVSGIYVDLQNLSIMDSSANVFAGCDSATKVAKALEKVDSNADLATFANIDSIAAVFAKYIDETKAVSAAAHSGTGYVITIDDPGYYLVRDEATTLKEGEAYTKYMIQVAGNAELAPKADAPTVMKKVKEDSKTGETGDNVTLGRNSTYKLNPGYNDVADYSMGEIIDFTLYGTLPETFANYKGYYYQFTDTMGTGLDLVDKDGGDTVDAGDFTVTVTDGSNKVTLTSPAQFTYAKTDDGFTITINDLKQIDMNTETGGVQVMSKDAVITVDYQATLNKNAVIGNSGNPNDVDLTYSNDSNTAQGGEEDKTGKTPKDYNVVFTYELDVTKYKDEEGTGHEAAAEEAGFKLYKEDGGVKKWAKFDTNNKFEEWVDDETNGTEIKTKSGGLVEFKGLQDGTYKLKETKTPVGYNTMADKTIVIEADTSNVAVGSVQNYKETADTGEGKMLVDVKLTVDGSVVDGGESDTTKNTDGTVDMSIINEKGAQLPSTGGIGTTLFYLGGGALVAVAGVMLITKKRMTKE